MYTYIFCVLLALTTLIVAWQDFKERLVSLWVLILYLLGNTLSVYFKDGLPALLENLLGTLCYFGICFLVLFVYYFLKEKKTPKIIDSKIGKADLLILLAIGISLPLILLIPFFTVAFILSALIALFVLKDRQSVPLAGILVILYFVFTLVRSSTNLFSGS